MESLNTKLTASLLIVILFGLTACAGTVIETATDAAVAVAKVPFKVGGAVIDVVAGEDDEEKQE